jgi:SAM-dependent methyltransferase
MEYPLGYSDAEHERLIRQARWVAPYTESFFRESGISAGQRVLDLGSGVGDVASIAARLVGPTGEVVGVERDGRSIERAQARLGDAGLRNVSFIQCDTSQIPRDRPFDAVVGRFILLFLPDPAGALRQVAQLVRPSGIVAFQEQSLDSFFLEQCARLPLWHSVTLLTIETLERSGVNPRMGTALAQVFQDAGLPAPSMRTEILLGSEQWVPDVLQSLRPPIEKLGLSTTRLGNLDTLSRRLNEELIESRADAPLPRIVGASSRLPTRARS